MREECPHCGRKLVSPCGSYESPVLLIGEFPGVQEIKLGIPFVGAAGEVLKTEMAEVGFDYNSCRVTNLWLHAKPTDKEIATKELGWHADRMYKEMKGRKAILLMGSELATFFLHASVMDNLGIILTPKSLAKYKALFMITPNPALLLQKGAVVGEFRFALESFVKEVKRRKIL